VGTPSSLTYSEGASVNRASAGGFVGSLVGSEVGLVVTMQLVSLLTFATKPSKHTQEWMSVSSLELSVFSHCVLLVSQP
jgi:hypothetical protein